MPAAPPRIPVSRLLACFFISGAAGLIYQIAWAKALGLIFGHTVYAVTAVLAVFMAGLATGSLYFGRLSERSSVPLQLYVRLEFLVGLTGAFSLIGLQAAHLMYVAIHPALAGSQTLLIAMRAIGAFTVLFIPTFLMGGTFPILVAAISPGAEDFAERVSQLYWANTGGATVGAILAGFVLLPSIGLRMTIVAGGSLNVIAAFIARISQKSFGDRQRYTSVAGCNTSTTNRALAGLFVLFALIGCSAFAYEIAWTRMLAITIGSSTYAFTLVLAVFLLGITIGSMLFQFYLSRSGPISVAVLGWVQFLIAAAALSSLIGFHWVPEWIPALLNGTHRTFAGLVVTQFAVVVLTVFPVAVVFGFNFPMVVDLIGHKQIGFASSAVGTAYAINTIGAIGGSVITGFWLLPLYGSFRVIAGVSAVNLLLAFAIHLNVCRRRIVSLAIDAALLAATFLIGSSPFLDNQSLLTLSAVLYGGSYGGRLTLSEIAATKDLVYAADGVNDSVAVVRTDGDVALRVNGKIDASTQDAPTQLLLGHLGAALHAKPRRVLIVGFGSGMTASAIACYPDVERIDTVEIEPAVLKAARFMHDLNRGVLKDPRLHITFDDARDFLLTSRENYDLIISEPSNPWISGVATLFTEEYYTAARKRLRPGGIFVQWVQAYSLVPSDLRMIIGTFATGFADVTLWRAGETDLLLLGRMEKSPLSLEHLHSLWQKAALHEDYESLKVHEPEGLAAYFLLDDQGVRQLAQGSPLNTDDRTVLEYDAPRSLLASESIDEDRVLIARFLTKPLPPLFGEESQRTRMAGLITALDLGEVAKAQALINYFPEVEDSFLDTARGRLALLQNHVARAKAFLHKAVHLDKKSPEAAYWFAVALRRSGDTSAALAQIEAALALNPDFVPALQEQMELAAARGDFVRALSAQLKRMALIPNASAYEYGRLGTLWLKIPDLTEAESALLKGLEKDPYCYACHLELGDVFVQRNELVLARQQFEWVIRFFPDAGPAAFTSLVVIDQFLSDTKSARRALDEGRRLFPNDVGLLKAQAAFTS